MFHVKSVNKPNERNCMTKSHKLPKRMKTGRPKENRPRFDLGTPELQLKRLAALGPQRAGWPQPDLAYAESPLGAHLWQGHLHADYERAKRLYDAGIMFAGWWVLVHPKTHAQGTLGQFQPKGSTAEIDTREAESNLTSASLFLKHERAVYDAVVNVCVYQRLNYDPTAMAKLRTGLCRLVEWQRSPEAEQIRQEFGKAHAA